MSTNETAMPGGSATKPKSEFTRHAILAVLGCWVGFLLGPNVMIAASQSNFLAELLKEFDEGAIGNALAAAPFAVAIMLPICGKLMDKFGVRAVVLPGIIVFGLAFFLLGRFINTWQFMALQIFLSVGAAMNSSVGYVKVINSWFDRNRGIMVGLCVALGAGVGQTSAPKISQWLIEAYGWRATYQLYGLALFVVTLPVVFLLVRPHKLAPGAQTDETTDHIDSSQVPGLTVKEAFRTPAYYKVFFAIMFGSMSLLGTMVFSRPIYEGQGFTIDMATTAASLAFLGVLIGEFSSGFFMDRWTTPRVVLAYFTVAWLGVLIVHSLDGTSAAMLYLGAIMLGMGFGGEVGMNAYMVSRYCGMKSFGTLYGFTFAASNIGIAIGIKLAVSVSVSTGSYANLLYIFGTTMLISVLCIASLPKFVYMPPKKA